MAKEGAQTRGAAVAAMTAITDDGKLASDVLSAVAASFEAGDRARVGRLVNGALRWAGRSDRLLGPHLRLKPEEQVLNILRLAIYEIFVENAPPHAVVDVAVSLAPRSKAGLVNGVLRNLLRRNVVWNETPLPRLPKWLRKPLTKHWGKAAVAGMERVFAEDPPLDVSLKVPGDAPQWTKRLGAKRRPDGGLRLISVGQVSAMPGFVEGAWWVQDAGASIAARVLDPHAEERVLDLCAAPGGKTMQLAARGAKVTSLDVSEERMKRVEENLARTGLSAEMVTADALKWDA